MKIEGVEITVAKKITKKILVKFDEGQAALLVKSGIKPVQVTNDKAKDEAAALEVSKQLSQKIGNTVELMALTAACFLVYERDEEKLDDEEIDKFLDEEIDFDELVKLGTMGATKLTEFQNARLAKKKSTGPSKSV